MRKKTLLNGFSLTEVCEPTDPGATQVMHSSGFQYYRRTYEIRHNEMVSTLRLKRFPIVFDTSGAQWAEATVFFIISLLPRKAPNMTTFSNIAEDLARYREFLDERNIQWTEFPDFQLHRPTYRFNGHMRILCMSEECAHSTARRTMGSVIAFYSLFIEKRAFLPAHNPWEKNDVYVSVNDKYGERMSKKVSKTDIADIGGGEETRDPDYIYDEGKLRPLGQAEQDVLFDSLGQLGNVEVTLFHLVAIDTAARIQTILTMRLRHILRQYKPTTEGKVFIPAGPGTGIDTKFGKKHSIQISVWVLELLKRYVLSERAISRRKKSKRVDNQDQYAFLTPEGNPFYICKEDERKQEPGNDRAYFVRGGSLRSYIRKFVIPEMRRRLDDRTYTYRVHWLRATAGMNYADERNIRVERGLMTRGAARDELRRYMWHEMASTSDGYLDYRRNITKAAKRIDEYESRLRNLAEKAMGSFNG